MTKTHFVDIMLFAEVEALSPTHGETVRNLALLPWHSSSVLLLERKQLRHTTWVKDGKVELEMFGKHGKVV